MRDWGALVRRELGSLALDEDEQSEIVIELALHLEEACDSRLRQGLSEEEAVKRALAEAGDWRQLRRKIQTAKRKEVTMTDRVKQFWLPGFLTLLLSMVLLMVIQFIGPRPLVVATHGWRMMTPNGVIYVPWLLLLLPIGALGAYLSGRAGASQRIAFLSIVFPVLPYLVLFLLAFPISLVLDNHVAHNIRYEALLMGLIAWVLLPGTALLAGGLPAHLILSRRLSFRRIASR